ncbi:unnamed protein product [Aphanomyces euteiches]|uniref:BAR domain-containing protein n=1 Tax=Aphanomyces euteiches TaxID=100861 RepID=A0A6G0WWC6_9STRA|nr:hypothetical protein Ae201684_010965 [Aphanomyces euteiches]KAH9058730.1 hypothetical protein Ae201684P_006071 [Aphanomyces euteiches]KAH9139815.1 hypothetical protein AeRB84_015921 [Aphanomyces euteiches]
MSQASPQPTTEERKGLMDKIRSAKRRFIQKALTKIGKAECSDDHEYQQLRDRQLELIDTVEHMLTHMKSFVTTLVSLGYGCTLLGEDMNVIRDNNAVKSPSYGVKPLNDCASNEFSQSMNRIDNAARELAASMLSTTVVANMQTKLDELHGFKKELEHRERLKLDYDSAVRKLRHAREHREAADVLRRDQKLQAAQAKLAESTALMVAKMKECEGTRGTMLQREVDDFRQMQAQFFQLCVSAFTGPPPPPRHAMSSKADEISQAEATNPFK